jgi:hypothetical protein
MPHLEPETKANYVDERRQNEAITAAKIGKLRALV